MQFVPANAILNALKRGVPDKAARDEHTDAMLHQRRARGGPDSNLLRSVGQLFSLKPSDSDILFLCRTPANWLRLSVVSHPRTFFKE